MDSKYGEMENLVSFINALSELIDDEMKQTIPDVADRELGDEASLIASASMALGMRVGVQGALKILAGGTANQVKEDLWRDLREMSQGQHG